MRVFSYFLRFNRLQLPLFPKGHPWSIRGGSFPTASTWSSGSGLALHQGCCSQRHTTQHCLKKQCKTIQQNNAQEKKIGSGDGAREPVEERLNAERVADYDRSLFCSFPKINFCSLFSLISNCERQQRKRQNSKWHLVIEKHLSLWTQNNDFIRL